MTGHLAAPALAKYLGADSETQNFPATLSYSITTDLLRGRLGFEGVIVTDALEMHAITKHFGEAEAAVLAFEAGADVLLMPNNPERAFSAIEDAIASGRISLGEIGKRISRINQLKLRTAIDPSTIGADRLEKYSSEHAKLAEEIARKAIRIRGKVDVHGAKLLIVTDDREQILKKAIVFAESMRAVITDAKISTPNEWAKHSANGGSDEFDSETILAVFHRARGFIGGDSAAESIPRIIADIAGSLTSRGVTLKGLVLIGSPYLGEAFQPPPGFTIKTYSESLASVNAALEKLQYHP
jgi:beta-glucosidase-like glycosyl hydrolase